MADCFISYRRIPSSAVAMTLQSKLESTYGIDAYVDTTRTDGTQVRFPERLMRAIEDAPVFVCLLGEIEGQHTLESDWVLKEIEHAYNLQKFCIPVFQESYRPLPHTSPAVEYLLSFDGVHILDQKNVMIDDSVRKLANLIRPHRKKRRLSPLLIAAAGLIVVAVIALNQLGVLPFPASLIGSAATPTFGENETSAPTPDTARTAAANATAIAGAEFEQTRLASTPTPTATSEPSATPTPQPPATATPATQINPVDATLTAIRENRANQTATALVQLAPTLTHVAAETFAAQATATQYAVETQVINLLATIETWTPTPTNTATATPTLTPTPAPEQVAQAGVARNADWQPYERDFAGTTMVLVPAGCFVMGNDPEGQFWNGERWVTGIANGGEQCFTAPFWIDKTEITNAAYGSVGCGESSDDPLQPRNCVNWFNARAFCEARGARLPTEAEWEYAARGPDGRLYPWGDEFNAEYVVDSGDFERQTAAVGSHPAGASWVGALDMSGNVWEWTGTLYADYPYVMQDGRERDDGDETNVLRTLRGGSFRSGAAHLRSANRHRLFPNNVIDDLGFRCARDYE